MAPIPARSRCKNTSIANEDNSSPADAASRSSLTLDDRLDLFLWPEFAQRVYDAASGDKELAWLETHNHIELYDQDPFVSEAVGKVLSWLDRVLPTASGAAA
jgi:fermentation-respiration switch protein FrsA (DUF1100 family)